MLILFFRLKTTIWMRYPDNFHACFFGASTSFRLKNQPKPGWSPDDPIGRDVREASSISTTWSSSGSSKISVGSCHREALGILIHFFFLGHFRGKTTGKCWEFTCGNIYGKIVGTSRKMSVLIHQEWGSCQFWSIKNGDLKWFSTI